MKKLIVFDLDGTLAVSKSAIDDEMAKLLHSLLGIVKVSVISGGDWPQFEKQVIDRLPQDDRLRDLFILPTCGTKFFTYKGKWEKLYSDDLTPAESEQIEQAFRKAIDESNFGIEKTWGDQIESRGTQITFSALGQEAPIQEKEKWDPDFFKRQKMRAVLEKLLPEFSIRLGGTTSVDVTKPGIDKGYGIRKLRDILGIAIEDMVFIGDAIFPGGNDYAAKEAGAPSIKVRDPEDSKSVIQAILLCLPTT